VQDQFLDGIRKNQQVVLGNVRKWAEATERLLPPVPAPTVPANYPQPRELVASQFDFAEKLLASQREFVEELVAVSVPTKAGASKASANETAASE
jgi:hypothetical protein